MGDNPTLARGTHWREMVGSMSAVSVGLNNQVRPAGSDWITGLPATARRADGLLALLWRFGD